MSIFVYNGSIIPKSLPARGAWVEITITTLTVTLEKSLPARGAWVEIRTPVLRWVRGMVAPRTGSVG